MKPARPISSSRDETSGGGKSVVAGGEWLLAKATAKGGFANENSLLKLLYAGILKASERWTHPIQNWNLTLAQLTIHFPGRLEKYLSL